MTLRVLLDFKRGSYSEIDDFCRQVLQKMDGVGFYAAEQPQVDIVKPLLQTYSDAVAAASDGGKSLTTAKKVAKKALLDAMTILALQVQLNAKDDETYLTGAGFNIKKKPQRSMQPLEKPVWKSLQRGVLSGTVTGEIANFPKGTKEVGISYSTDQWATEKNGTYSTGKRFTLKDLPVQQEIEIKVCFTGTFQRKSDHSEPMKVFVL